MAAVLGDITNNARRAWLYAGCKTQQEPALLATMKETIRKSPDVPTAVEELKQGMGHGIG